MNICIYGEYMHANCFAVHTYGTACVHTVGCWLSSQTTRKESLWDKLTTQIKWGYA